MAKEFLSQGGVDYARSLLEQALGAERAQEILRRITASLQVRPFDFMRHTDAQQVLSFIQGEHPRLSPSFSPISFPNRLRRSGRSARQHSVGCDAAHRHHGQDHSEVLREVERVLERKLSSVLGQDFTIAGGIEAVVDIINRVDPGTERNIMEMLEEKDPDLAEESNGASSSSRT